MQVLSYNYQAIEDDEGQGFAYTATLIRQARREAENVILVDNGDLLTGASVDASILTDTTAIHPMIGIMNDLGYDAATVGNHDFDYGLPYLLKATMQADFPLVSANTFINLEQKTSRNQTLFNQFTILDRQVIDENGLPQTIRIGITGFLPPGSVPQFEDNEYRIHTPDIIEAAAKIIPTIKAKGADIVIVLAHTGIGPDKHTVDMENAAVPLAKIDDIDAIVFGHRHQLFPGPGWSKSEIIDIENSTIHGTPMISSGALGSHLGIIDLELTRENDRWVVLKHACTNRPIQDKTPGAQRTLPDPVATRLIASTHQQMLDWMARPIGYTHHPLTSFFALASPSCAVQAIQRAAIWYVQTHFAKYYDPALPLLSSACAFKSGGYGGPLNFTDIEAGKITKRGLTDLYPFYNHIGLLKMNGAQLTEWLERSASVFNTAYSNKTNQVLKSPEVAAYLYETILGLDYAIDLSQPARYDPIGYLTCTNSHRITDLTYAGQPVTMDQEFTLITNNYRQGGGGFYPPSCLEKRIPVPGTPMQNVLAAFFSAHQFQSFALEKHWRFAPVANAKLTFRSSPAAVNYLPDLSNESIQALNLDTSGYQLFQLSL